MDAYRKLFTATLLSLALLAGLPGLATPAQAMPNGAQQAPISAGPRAAQSPRLKRQALFAKLAQLSPHERAVVRDLAALERLYRQQGKPASVDALYRELLKRTQNPTLRSFAERRLAKSAAHRGDFSSAESHLRASLNAGLNRAELNQF